MQVLVVFNLNIRHSKVQYGSATNYKNITRAWELCEAGVPKTHIAERVGVTRDTVRLWVKGISSAPEGLLGFLDSYKRAKKGPRAKRKLDGLLKKRIYRIRKEVLGPGLRLPGK